MKLASSELGRSLYELGMQLQGPYGAAVDIGVEAELCSRRRCTRTSTRGSSSDPRLNVFFGQPSTTLLSVLSGDAGRVLDRIPPVLN